MKYAFVKGILQRCNYYLLKAFKEETDNERVYTLLVTSFSFLLLNDLKLRKIILKVRHAVVPTVIKIEIKSDVEGASHGY